MAGTAPETAGSRPPAPNRWLSAFAVIIAMVGHTWLQNGMLFTLPNWSLAQFRNYFWPDQLGYLSIAANVARGHSADVEPFTETGTIHYPRSYYVLLGQASRALGLDPITAWNLFGILSQAALVAALSLVLISLSRHWWAGLLAPAPFILGTFAWTVSTGWHLQLTAHAVLWGPFGVLHTLNGEAFALCVAGIALLTLLWVWQTPHAPMTRVLTTVAVSLTIGWLANVHTYTFISAVYIVVFVAAVWAILERRRWIYGGATVLLVGAVFLLGPSVSEAGGQLVTLMFGLIPAAPGMIALVIRTRGLAAVYLVAGAAAAAPQVVGTLAGLAAHDPFLLYRVVVTENLSVPPVVGLAAGLAVLVPVAFIGTAAIARRKPLWGAYAIAAPGAWFLLAENNVWGVDAEPYRLWLNAFVLVSLTTLPMLVLAVRCSWQARSSRAVIAVAIVLCTVIAAGSAGDWLRFYRTIGENAFLTISTPRESALTDLAELSAATNRSAPVITDPCINPEFLKVTADAPMATFRVGMAWPTRYKALDQVISNRHHGRLDVASAVSANALRLVTDGACTADWATRYGSELHKIRSISYGNGPDETVTLWQLAP